MPQRKWPAVQLDGARDGPLQTTHAFHDFAAAGADQSADTEDLPAQLEADVAKSGAVLEAAHVEDDILGFLLVALLFGVQVVQNAPDHRRHDLVGAGLGNRQRLDVAPVRMTVTRSQFSKISAMR